MQVPDFREKANLNGGESAVFEGLMGQYELVEEHVLNPSEVSYRVYSG